jgi:DNA gyrase subunit A
VSESENESGPEIVDKAISEEMHESYMQYAMSVIKSRALPDVRDGLKPSQRRVLYTMHDMNLGPRAGRVKSARVVGDCMGRFHPHGDQAIYATLVRMAQDFSSRYVLVDKKGNFGTVVDPSPAAMRYTECRMAPAAADMVADIDRNTVDMQPNYDEREEEPNVLPSRFPNLICNGSQGIAVGMATSIPPHNLNEVSDALIALAGDPALSDAAVLRYIPGPDFPTAGIICGTEGIRSAYLTGRGHITVRGKVDIDVKKDKATITITQLPYQVTTDQLKEKVQEAAKAGRLEGVASLKDRSKKDVNIVLECKKGEDPNIVINQLYKFTPLQETFSIIMIALERDALGRDRPRTFTLRELLQAFIKHRYEVIRRRTQFLLDQALARIHVLEGLQAAVDLIDEVIKLIRAAKSPDDARDVLRARLVTKTIGEDKKPLDRPLSEKQANAILAMQLQRLTGLERDKLSGDLKKERDTAADLVDILRLNEPDPKKRDERVSKIFCEEMTALKAQYGDARRTVIEQGEAREIDDEDLIADETTIVTITHQGYVKRTGLDQYRIQARAGKGLYGAGTKDDDFVSQMFQASTKDYLLCFTSHGRVHWLKVHQIPEGARTARGKGLRNLITLLPDEQVTSLIPISGEFGEDRFLVMGTALGVIKKTTLSAFARPKKGGIIAVTLDEGDALVGVALTDGKRELVVATQRGKAIRFPEETVRPMGRAARGVKSMELVDGDRITSLVVAGADGPELLTVCQFGHGKRTPVEDYRETNRGGKGIINIKTEGRNGNVVAVAAVKLGDQVMIITTSGKSIRMRIDDVPSIGRNTQGVRLIKVEEGETVVAVAKVVVDEESGAEQPETQRPVESAPPPGEAEAPEPADEGEAGPAGD